MQGTPENKWLYDLIAKWGTPVFYIFLAIMGKLALYKKSDKLDKGKVASTAVLGFISGWIATEILFYYNKAEMIAFVVPLSTMFGEAVMMWCLNNADKILNKKILEK